METKIMNKFKKIALGIGSAATLIGGSTYPIFPPEPITYQEYREIMKMYDSEIKAEGNMTFENIDMKDLQKELHKKIRARKISGAENNEREKLLKMTEKKSLLEKIKIDR